MGNKSGRRAEHQRFWKLGRLEGDVMKADNFMKSEGWPQEVGVELRGNAGALSIPPGLKGEKDEQV